MVGTSWLTRHRRTGSRTGAEGNEGGPAGVRIRPRTERDLAACARLAGLVDPHGERGFPPAGARRSWLAGDDVLQAWIAERRGELLGHAALRRPGPDAAARMRFREVCGHPLEEIGEIAQVFVRASARRQRVGTALLASAVSAARDRHLLPAMEFRTPDPEDIEFLEGQGWRMLSMQPVNGEAHPVTSYLLALPPL